MMQIPNWLKNPLIVLLVSFLTIMLTAFVSVMVSKCAHDWIGGLLGLFGEDNKNEILKFLGIGMGGILLAIQAVLSYIRAKAMEDAAKAQADATKQQAKANQNAEKGLRQERLKNASNTWATNRIPCAWAEPTNSSIWRRIPKIYGKPCLTFSAPTYAGRQARPNIGKNTGRSPRRKSRVY